MESFLEHLEQLKHEFSQLPDVHLSEAIVLPERMDAAVEEMTQSVIFIEDNFQNTQEECLVDMGKHMVEDFLDPSAADFLGHLEPSTSSQDFIYYDDVALDTTTSSSFVTSQPRELYCFTCGDAFNNRKGLYRHGKTAEHATRPPRRKIERKIQIPAEPPEKPPEIPKKSIKICGEKSICAECSGSFPNRKALYRHGKQTNHQTHFQRGMNIKGGSIRCEKCEYSSDSEKNLKRHCQRNHSKFSAISDEILL
ncbi:C2H2-type domain-containing protein [Caenorhabditis elegans]|uniref:C2H2-type domain-containing protein n=1 Tax=Caenorhabditis elegans TaxID=6239 RepID=A0A8S4QC20_CAEEL|nr:C2H2-type domain-containing protein [Caenorhabditis elegans]CAH2188601.1 C2H2-type domain-containing protein [Caenorhabditis elegans]